VKSIRVTRTEGKLWLIMTEDSGTDRHVGPCYIHDVRAVVNTASVLAKEHDCEFLVDDDVIEQMLVMPRY
jgi:3-deoxy-D-arabino-heptulosonate 7-phosphate (DAHP) synthase